MSELMRLKAATSLHDVAHILGFQPKSLAYILYKKPAVQKYHQFDIPKRSGGTRRISAPYPDLMNLQKRLSDLLQNCISEINQARKVESALSHGFRRKHSIITNAAGHRNRRYVFNVDLENFFGTINFGRVRGYFIKNKNFELDPAVATVLAQIVCHNHVLPQGSPCSPVISNLIGHVLDIRLAELAYKTGCTYSRYADDLTFSTNRPIFPARVATPIEDREHQWQAGKDLERIIQKAGFAINPAKTRMQLNRSRQDVTGLVVNTKVNTRAEYRRNVRAMTHRLLKTGRFQRTETKRNDKGDLVTMAVDGTLEQLNGMLSFIDTVGVYNKKISQKKSDSLDSKETVYRSFLFYKDFYAPPTPVIVCEGKTDNVYIRAAIRRLAGAYPQLAETKKKGAAGLKVRIYRYTNTTGRMLGLAGGTGDLGKLVRMYSKECAEIDAPRNLQPVILLVDNDDGANGKGGIYNAIKDVSGTKPDGTKPFYHICHNLYVVPTPLTSSGGETMIEDFFDPIVKATKVSGKSFNPSSKGFNNKTEYGKHVFAEQVVKKNEGKIDFNGFNPILERIVAVLNAHPKLVSP